MIISIWIYQFHSEQIHIIKNLNKPLFGYYKFISAGHSIVETNLIK